MSVHKLSEVELNFEIEMSVEKLQEIINRVEVAKQIAMKGQTLRIKINHNTCLIFREVGQINRMMPATSIDPVEMIKEENSVKMQ